jgi:micrococcal nuclease
MAKHFIYGVFGLLAASVIALAIYLDKPAPEGAAVLSEGQEEAVFEESGEAQSASVAIAGETSTRYKVVKVIDGDTVTITKDGASETVRMIGINAPETGQCFTAEATQKLKSLIGAGTVSLELDASQGERDKYDRLLAYVFTESGINTAKALIEGGFAKEYTYSRAYKYQAQFKAAQAAAQSAGKGLWASGACTNPASAPVPSAPTSVQTETKQEPPPSTPSESEDGGKEDLSPLSDEVESGEEDEPPAQPASSGSYSQAPPDGAGYTCSSNTYNCDDFSTHAEAQAVYEACGGVSNDVHRLDANKDGLACESLP